MKTLMLALFIAAVTAAPILHQNGPVDVVVNGVPDGHALEVGHIVTIDVQQQIDGQTVVENALHPFSTAGIIEAAIAAEANKPSEPSPVVAPEPSPVAPEPVNPEPPTPVQPELPELVVLPEPPKPEVIPEPIILPEQTNPGVDRPVPEVNPELIPSEVPRPVPEAQPEVIVLPDEFTPADSNEILPVPSGIIYNDGVVDITVNGPTDYNIMGTLKNWFSLAINYITGNSPKPYVKQVM